MVERPDVVHMTSVHSPEDIRIFHKEAVGLARAGFRVCLVATGEKDELRQGVMLLSVPKTRTKRSRIPVANILRRAVGTGFRVFLRAWASKARIVHYHDPELAPYALLLKVFGRRTVVKDAHEDFPKQIHSKPYIPDALKRVVAGAAWIMERAACLSADIVVAATPAIAESFPAGKTIVVQNFPLLGELATSTPTAICDRPPWIAYVGGITRIRSACEMVEAIGKVVYPGARLKMAGAFEQTGLRERLGNAPGATRMDALGTLPRWAVADLLGHCRLGLVLYHPLPNHIEAQPNKLFEYMSAGIPVIASDFPLWRQLVEGVGCGILVDPLDPSAIAVAIDHLLAHPVEAEVMGRRGQEAVLARFNWGSEEKKLLEIYRRLICG
jgi:glycosyltransferase involved in cell wall biosynthesis